jgi:hypothetical protein
LNLRTSSVLGPLLSFRLVHRLEIDSQQVASLSRNLWLEQEGQKARARSDLSKKVFNCSAVAFFDQATSPHALLSFCFFQGFPVPLISFIISRLHLCAKLTFPLVTMLGSHLNLCFDSLCFPIVLVTIY